MTLVKSFTAPSGHNYVFALTSLSGYVFAGYNTNPGRVDKISPSTMSLVKTFTPPSGHNFVYSLTSLSGYVFVGYNTSPGHIDKISPSTMTLVKTFTAPSRHNIVHALTSLSGYLFADYHTSPAVVTTFVGFQTGPAYVDKINPSTMSLVKTFTPPSGHNYVTALTILAA